MNFLKVPKNWFDLCRKQAAKYSCLFVTLLSFIFLFSGPSFANDGKNLEDILKLKNTPAGVVIEIVTDDEDNLEWALPRAKEYIQQLRGKFPKLAIAIVTHGEEQFSLTKDSQEDNEEIHQLVKSLGKDDVPVHVCETFAGWQGLGAEDFPDYVNVSAAGPAQVNDYLSLGYKLILIDEE